MPMFVTVLLMMTYQASEVTVEDYKGFTSQQIYQTWQSDGEKIVTNGLLVK